MRKNLRRRHALRAGLLMYKKRNRILLVVLLVLLGIGGVAANRFLIVHIQKTGIHAPVSVTHIDKEQMAALPIPEIQEGDTGDSAGTTLIGAVDGENRISIKKIVSGEGKSRITYYVADVKVKSVKEIKACFADDSYGQNIREKTSSMARRCQAVFAVNGDYYGYRDNGIIIRNGELYREAAAREGLALYQDGYMGAYDEAGAGGQLEKNHFIFVVVDGRQEGYSCGMSFVELADLMKSIGCENAYNLDGGNSATMYFEGRVVNHPSSKYHERSISDCIFIS